MVTIERSQEIIWRNQGVRIEAVMRGLQARGIPFATNVEETP